MWMRNLLFFGLILAGIGGLTAALFPAPVPPRVHHFNPGDFEKPEFQAVVEQVNAAWRQKWATANLEPASPADELAIARRLSLALAGTIPSLQEIRQLQAQDPRERLAWWTAGLLQDQRSADYLAERLARVYVGTENGPFLVYRRRRFVSWLSDELMHQRPYDQLVRSLIADEGLWTDRPATNFITVTVEQANKNQPNPERLAARVARAFLGIRLDCAQCHNHPFDKWKQADFQGLAAFFGQVKEGLTGTHDDSKIVYQIENRKTGEQESIGPRVPFQADLLPTTGTRRQQLAAWVTNPRNPYFARVTVNRIWALLFGRPMLEYVDDVSSLGEVPPALQILADDFVAHQYDLRRLIQLIAATEVFQLESAADHEVTAAHERAWAAFPLTRLRPEQVVGSLEQTASLSTLDADTHILVKLFKSIDEKDFVHRYGDSGEEELAGAGGTIPQRLLMMNGKLVLDKTKENPLNASTRVGWQAPDDRSAVRIAYLTILTREPTPEESSHFAQRLAGSRGNERSRRMEDLYWVLVNSTEFAWNH